MTWTLGVVTGYEEEGEFTRVRSDHGLQNVKMLSHRQGVGLEKLPYIDAQARHLLCLCKLLRRVSEPVSNLSQSSETDMRSTALLGTCELRQRVHVGCVDLRGTAPYASASAFTASAFVAYLILHASIDAVLSIQRARQQESFDIVVHELLACIDQTKLLA